MYSFSLNLYYLCIIKYNMREKRFQRKIEPFIHIIPAVWSVGGSTFALFSKMFNPGKSTFLNLSLMFSQEAHTHRIIEYHHRAIGPSGGCFLSSKPLGCHKNDDVECERGENGPRFFLFYGAIPNFLCIIGIITTLVTIYAAVRSQEKKMNKYRIKRVSYKRSTRVAEPGYEENSNGNERERKKLEKKPKKIKSKGRRFLKLACLYVSGFMLTYVFSYVGE
jgi:hypothetical protein